MAESDVAQGRELHRSAPDGTPALIAIDQEGGTVQRVRAPATHWHQVFFPIPRPVTIKPGMNVAVRIQPFEVAGANTLHWRWRLAVDDKAIDMDDLTYQLWLRSRDKPFGPRGE